MRHIVIVWLLLCCGISGSAQSCYKETRSKGLALYLQKKYNDAINVFEAAKVCPDKPADNDLEQKIRDCRNAIKKEKEQKYAEENARREEERSRRNNEEQIAAKGYMDILDIEFANKDSISIVNDYGSTLYASDVKYLQARIVYNSLSSSFKKIALSCKIYDPSGNLKSGSNSPAGYSFIDDNIRINPGNGNKEIIIGYGNKTGGTYTPGTYRYEIWYKDRKLFEKPFTLYKKEGEASYLKVNNRTSVSTSFSEQGGSEIFYVSTDADSWTTWGIPSFCSIVNKTSTSFKLVCEANNKRETRSDYMKIKAGNKEVRIDISQEAKRGPSAKVEKLWVDHNVMNGYLKGMKIHIKLEVSGMKGRTVKFCVFFYKEDNTTKLVNMYGSHISSSTTDTSTYENCVWSDWWIFVPYTNIFSASNSNGRFSLDVEIQDMSGSLLTRKENYQFHQN